MGHRFDPTILREYDIRGIVGTTLSAADARAIGRAYALTLADAHGRRLAPRAPPRETGTKGCTKPKKMVIIQGSKCPRGWPPRREC